MPTPLEHAVRSNMPEDGCTRSDEEQHSVEQDFAKERYEGSCNDSRSCLPLPAESPEAMQLHDVLSDLDFSCSRPVIEPSNVTSKSSKEAAEHDVANECERVLSLLCEARKRIATELEKGPLPETFFCPLDRGVPLRPLKKHGFHGWCDIHVERYEDVADGARRAVGFTVRSIGLHFYAKNGMLLPVELLLATYIHELAHTVTRPEMRHISNVSESVLKLQPHVREASTSGFIQVHHSDLFYANFGVLLRAAERSGVYVLPSSPNKFAPKSLMRFDNIDVEASIGGLNLGRSPLFGSALGAAKKPLQVLLTDTKRVKQKPLTLENPCIAEVLLQAKQRLNLRKRPTSVADSSGRPVDDSELKMLQDGAILIIT